MNSKPHAYVNLSSYRNKQEINQEQYQPQLIFEILNSDNEHESDDEPYENQQIQNIQKEHTYNIHYSTLNLSEHSSRTSSLNINNSQNYQKLQLRQNIQKLQEKNSKLIEQLTALKKQFQCSKNNHEKRQRDLKKQVQQLRFQLSKRQDKNLIYKRKYERVDEIKENINYQTNQTSQSIIYSNITKYLKNIVNQLLSQISNIKMNPQLNSLLDDFFQQLVNINPNTVNRIASRSPFRSRPIDNLSDCQALTPFSSKFRDVQLTNKLDKSSERLQLDKSIEKLKDMEKNQHNISYSNMQEMQRSSIMMHDRSKSRRKKIFN